MSKIKELLESNQTVYIFDVDGVLVKMEFGEYNHYILNDDDWALSILDNDYYTSKSPIKTMQDFLQNKDMNRVYVATKVMNETEKKQKIAFLHTHYHILEDHIYEVYDNEEKLDVMKKVQEFYPELEDKYFVMVDDTVDILTYIMDHSSYSTVHISTFLK